MDREGLTADDVETITAHVAQIGIDNAGKTEVSSGLEGKFSIPYAIARTLLTQETGIEGYTDAKASAPGIAELMSRVRLTVDDEHRNAGLRTTVKLKRKNGEELVGTHDPMDHIPGPELRRERVGAKFLSLAKDHLGLSQSRELLNLILDGEDATPAGSIPASTQATLEMA